jgi:predicted amidohydrolase
MGPICTTRPYYSIGTIVGKYRKTQVPLAELSGGIAPGADVPVFQTDFGKVALLICQDTAFPEPARQAAIQGAEVLLVPIWGGKQSAVAARALEHSVYVVASGYDYVSEVLDPLANVLARVPALNTPDAAVATINLAQRFRETGLATGATSWASSGARTKPWTGQRRLMTRRHRPMCRRR